MMNEEGESPFDGLLHSAFQEERSFVVQQVAVSLVDGAEDRRLQKSPLVLDHEEVHAVTALRRRALETFDHASSTGAGAVRQRPDLLALNHPEIFECPSVRFERVTMDIQT